MAKGRQEWRQKKWKENCLSCGAKGWSRGVVEGRGQRRVKDNVRQRENRRWDEIAFRLGIKLRRGIRGAPGVLPTLGALNSEGEDAGRGRGGCGSRREHQ
jgi:hypothetical protein